jgi:hypothetical protein
MHGAFAAGNRVSEKIILGFKGLAVEVATEKFRTVIVELKRPFTDEVQHYHTFR